MTRMHTYAGLRHRALGAIRDVGGALRGLALALLWQNLAIDRRYRIERSRCRGVRGKVA
jgi:hypothetical protein